MDSKVIAGIILPMVKASPKIVVSILIANICSQFDYTPSYRKALIAKQKRHLRRCIVGGTSHAIMYDSSVEC